MEAMKPWYQSKTIWASIVSIAAAAGGMLGVPINAAEGAALTESILQTITAVSALVAIAGRLMASSRIG